MIDTNWFGEEGHPLLSAHHVHAFGLKEGDVVRAYHCPEEWRALVGRSPRPDGEDEWYVILQEPAVMVSEELVTARSEGFINGMVIGQLGAKHQIARKMKAAGYDEATIRALTALLHE